MNNQFLKIAGTISKNMYQVIMNVNTTIVLCDKDCKVVEIWNNVSSMQEYTLDIKVGDDFQEKTIGVNAMASALKENTIVESSEGLNLGNRSYDLYSIASPLRNAYDEVIGGLGVFGPMEMNINFIRGTVKIGVMAIEGQTQAVELKSDYDKVYKQLIGTIETIPIGTIVTDNKMSIIHANDATQKIFGDDLSSIIGKDLDEYLHTGRFFHTMMEKGQTMLDEEMTFNMPDGTVNCEVIVSLVKGEENQNLQGLVIKLKNTKYMYTFKKSKDDNKAYFLFEDIIGNSPALREAIRLGKIAARSTSNVLITGESGTGKELFAQSIHNHSTRREGPFVAVNCGALPGGLIESELFGYEGGAFTGAKKEGQKGKFENADGGTLFLDEIGDMPISEQIRLLRVLQNKEIVRVGGNRTIKINVRIIAATNRDIEELVLEKKFRSDLYYRLNVFSIPIPTLNERVEDVIPISDIFIKRYSVLNNKDVTGIDDVAKHALMMHQWAGNIRELENVIERAVNITRSNKIGIEDLPASFKNLVQLKKPVSHDEGKDLTVIQELERNAIVETLTSCGGNISKTAEILGIGRRSLYRRLEEYGIDNENYKRRG